MRLLLALASVAGLVVGISGAGLYDRLFDDPAVAAKAKAAGKLEERQAWEELRRRAEIKAEQDRQAAQDKIDAAERLRLLQQSIHDQQIEALRATIDESDDDVSKSSGTVSAARARRLRDSLDAVGRNGAEAR